MIVSDDKQLQDVLLKEYSQKLQRAAHNMWLDLKDEMASYYNNSEPKWYQRTGMMKNIPSVSEVKTNGNAITVDVYLDEDWYVYPDGKQPTMAEVVNLANTGSGAGLRPTVGPTGFWERAEKTMIETFEREFKDFK